MDNCEYILSLSVSDFKRIKRAQRILWQTGMSSRDAVELLVSSHRAKACERETRHYKLAQ